MSDWTGGPLKYSSAVLYRLLFAKWRCGVGWYEEAGRGSLGGRVRCKRGWWGLGHWMAAAKDASQTNSIKSHTALPGRILDLEIRDFSSTNQSSGSSALFKKVLFGLSGCDRDNSGRLQLVTVSGVRSY